MWEGAHRILQENPGNEPFVYIFKSIFQINPHRSSRAHGDDGALSGHGGRVRGE